MLHQHLCGGSIRRPHGRAFENRVDHDGAQLVERSLHIPPHQEGREGADHFVVFLQGLGQGNEGRWSFLAMGIRPPIHLLRPQDSLSCATPVALKFLYPAVEALDPTRVVMPVRVGLDRLAAPYTKTKPPGGPEGIVAMTVW